MGSARVMIVRAQLPEDASMVRYVNELAFGQCAEADLVETLQRQREGIGSGLVRRGLEILRARGCPFVVVVGHPEYYPRFGFERASVHGLTSQWDGIPDEAFLAILLDPAAMAGVSGVARYRSEFDEVT
jgi:predicted N-acetyltransferase YhbS